MRSPGRAWRVEALGLGAALAATLVGVGEHWPLLSAPPAGEALHAYRDAALSLESLRSGLRFDGWDAGLDLGRPLRPDPLPLLALAAAGSVLALPEAFRLVALLGLVGVGLAAYTAMRLLGFGIAGGLAGVAATLAAWLLAAGQATRADLSANLGAALALLSLASLAAAHASGRSPRLPAALLAATALSSLQAAAWVGLSGSFLLCASRQPARTRVWLIGLGVLTLALSAPALLPALASASAGSCCEALEPAGAPSRAVPQFWSLLAAAPLVLVLLRRESRWLRKADPRPLFLLHAGLMAWALGVLRIEAGLDPGAARLGWLAIGLAVAAALAVSLRARPGLLTAVAGLVGVVALAAWSGRHAPAPAQEPSLLAVRELGDRLGADAIGARVLLEQAAAAPGLDAALALRLGERGVVRGVDNGDPPYPMAAEASATSDPPLRSLRYLRRGSPDALRRLQLLGVGAVIAHSGALTAAIDRHGVLGPAERIGPYSVYRVPGSVSGLVEPLALAPVRAAPGAWRERARRWITRQPLSPALLVFGPEPALAAPEPDAWLAPPAVPLAAAVSVAATSEPQGLRIQTDRPGHPLLVKLSAHPRWRAFGAEGPYPVTPCFMLLLPQSTEVRLVYARSALEAPGLLLSLASLVLLLWRGSAGVRLLPSAPGDAAGATASSGLAIPGLLAVAYLALQSVALAGDPAQPHEELAARALRAHAQKDDAAAAEYARHAIPDTGPLRDEMLTLRGESLLRGGRAWEAAEAFGAVLRRGSLSPYRAQALFGAARAHAAAGDAEAAAAARDRLLEEFSDTPWARLVAGTEP